MLAIDILRGQWIAIMIVFGIVLAWVTYIALYGARSRRAEAQDEMIEFPADLKEAGAGVPVVLVLSYVFIGLTLIGYLFIMWLTDISY
jgi:uncharacterized membrane protein YqhA